MKDIDYLKDRITQMADDQEAQIKYHDYEKSLANTPGPIIKTTKKS